jgi:transposase
VRLIAPQLAKRYVARGKNDAADAAALCEAARRTEHALRAGEIDG